MQSSDEYEVISNDSAKIKDLEQRLLKKTQNFAEILSHFSDFGLQISKNLDFLSDRVQVLKLSSEKSALKAAYLADLEELRQNLRNLLFYKESVEQTFKKDAENIEKN